MPGACLGVPGAPWTTAALEGEGMVMGRMDRFHWPQREFKLPPCRKLPLGAVHVPCSCLNFFKNNYAWPHLCRTVHTDGGYKTLLMSCRHLKHLPTSSSAPRVRGSTEKKKGSRPFPLPLSDFCLDRAQTNVASINLFSFKAHVSGHFKGRIA